jgi:hypothetical protein
MTPGYVLLLIAGFGFALYFLEFLDSLVNRLYQALKGKHGKLSRSNHR